ncbi:MAG: response regulator transcription factor [Rhodococcus sp. (in: high G+C Gram-positive bacteria)]|uniref:winged helix-turn-helix transcriptional regulator n=1 Tax=Rhodococcus sp. TaxID=1831 RepID=UPI002ADACE6E|nr:response regulator transcription factor [Rhodococcus sp. (in: high G+C Gram-positive bacteria)]MDZ7930628.1 response regulator transcription factor [Rhodococcus sp. (in: high G+C Gram-positive bacteria)]
MGTGSAHEARDTTGSKEATSRPTASLLLSEHDPAVAASLITAATARGIAIEWYRDGAATLLAVGAELPTLVVLSAASRVVSAEDVVLTIRARSQVPILVGADSDALEARRALQAGASAVVARPYDIDTIATFAASKNPEDISIHTVSAGPLMIDRSTHAAWWHGREILLSQREFDLLAYLFEQHGRIVSQELISRRVWGHPSETNTVAVHIKRLRDKLGTDPHYGQIIRTIRGLGYGLSPSLYQSAATVNHATVNQ